jgi:hypothetical protein
MTFEEVQAAFEKHEDEHLEFERIPEAERRHARPDLCAFLLLAELFPGTSDMICASEHDEFFLDPEIDDDNCPLTEEHIIYLQRCGVRMGEFGLCMFA